jgi:hypothetical protein
MMEGVNSTMIYKMYPHPAQHKKILFSKPSLLPSHYLDVNFAIELHS